MSFLYIESYCNNKQYRDFLSQYGIGVLWNLHNDIIPLDEKIIITIATLITINQDRFLPQYFKLFIQSARKGFDLQDIIKMIAHHSFFSEQRRTEIERLNVIAVDALEKTKGEQDYIEGRKTTLNLEALLDAAIVVASGEVTAIERMLDNICNKPKGISELQLRVMMLHQMLYSGCPCAMIALGIMQEKGFSKHVISLESGAFKKQLAQDPSLYTKTFISLYGQKAQEVIDQCYKADQFFGQWVQCVVYGDLWSRSDVSIDKSIATIVSLIALGKAKLIQIHLLGFKNLGGRVEDILAIVAYISDQGLLSQQYEEIALERISNVYPEKLSLKELLPVEQLSASRKAIVDLALMVALCQALKPEVLKNIALNKEQIQELVLLLITYCGACRVDFALYRIESFY